MDFRRSINFDSLMECKSIAASTEEILWSDDDTIIAEQEMIWNEGRKLSMSMPSLINYDKMRCRQDVKITNIEIENNTKSVAVG